MNQRMAGSRPLKAWTTIVQQGHDECERGGSIDCGRCVQGEENAANRQEEKDTGNHVKQKSEDSCPSFHPWSLGTRYISHSQVRGVDLPKRFNPFHYFTLANLRGLAFAP